MLTKTVLITGASSGIGAAFAKCYAKLGCQLVLVARDITRLNQVATLCQQQGAAQVIVIVADLTDNAAAATIYQELKSQQISVDILINNAGFGLRGSFVTLPFAELQKMMQVHMTALTELTQLFLSDMLPKQQGHIVNIASAYGCMPVPMQAVYAATKAYVVNLSLGLAEELKNTGIKVTVICPGMTESLFHHRAGMHPRKNSPFMLSADTVAQKSLQAITQGKIFYVPGWLNKLFIGSVGLLPKNILAPLVSWLVYKVRRVD